MVLAIGDVDVPATIDMEKSVDKPPPLDGVLDDIVNVPVTYEQGEQRQPQVVRWTFIALIIFLALFGIGLIIYGSLK